jgi:hypothetical protein
VADDGIGNVYDGMDISDRILANVRSDMIALALNDELINAKNRKDWLGALASNLRALALRVERDKLPDPFPYFRHGDSYGHEDLILGALRDAREYIVAHVSDGSRTSVEPPDTVWEALNALGCDSILPRPRTLLDDENDS